MTIDRLYYFKVVAEELNFTRAAQTCHIAQTAMSRQISMMEKEINCKLLNRSSRNVELTEACKIFYHEVVSILTQYESAVRKTQEIAHSTFGHLRIGIGQFARSFVSKLIAEFHRLYPQIEITIEQYSYKMLMHNLQIGSIDVAFALPVCTDYFAPHQIESIELFKERLCAYVCSASDLSHLKINHREDLTGKTFITTSEDDGPCSLAAYMERIQYYRWPVEKVVQANSLVAELLMVEADMGIAVGTACIKDNITQGVTIIPLSDDLYPEDTFSALVRKDRSNVTELFVGGIKTSHTLDEWQTNYLDIL